MADTTTTTTVDIGNISNQLTVASRVVVSTDGFWVQTGGGQSVRIPAEFVRAYLGASITPSISADGTWKIGDTDTGLKAAGSVTWAYFYRVGNKLYLYDELTSISGHTKMVGNKIVISSEE